jgi:hypothetical protein
MASGQDRFLNFAWHVGQAEITARVANAHKSGLSIDITIFREQLASLHRFPSRKELNTQKITLLHN